nr:NAD(P)-binding domain-containing protein [Ktedonobacteraceae bacterium]
MAETIGFIGLGIMGKPMAHNLLEAGYSLIILNRHQEGSTEFAALSVRAVQHPQDIAAQCQTVITMLPDSPQVEEVIAGPDGILASVHEGLVVIDMSTISPVVTRQLAAQLAEHGAALLD